MSLVINKHGSISDLKHLKKDNRKKNKTINQISENEHLANFLNNIFLIWLKKTKDKITTIIPIDINKGFIITDRSFFLLYTSKSKKKNKIDITAIIESDENNKIRKHINQYNCCYFETKFKDIEDMDDDNILSASKKTNDKNNKNDETKFKSSGNQVIDNLKKKLLKKQSEKNKTPTKTPTTFTSKIHELTTHSMISRIKHSFTCHLNTTQRLEMHCQKKQINYIIDNNFSCALSLIHFYENRINNKDNKEIHFITYHETSQGAKRFIKILNKLKNNDNLYTALITGTESDNDKQKIFGLANSNLYSIICVKREAFNDPINKMKHIDGLMFIDHEQVQSVLDKIICRLFTFENTDVGKRHIYIMTAFLDDYHDKFKKIWNIFMAFYAMEKDVIWIKNNFFIL